MGYTREDSLEVIGFRDMTDHKNGESNGRENDKEMEAIIAT